MTGHIDGSSTNFPREGNSFGAIVDGCIALLGRSSKTTINEMQLIAMSITLGVVAKNSTIAETKSLTSLLADIHALGQRSGAITLGKFIRIGIGFDSATKLLIRHQVQILNVIGVQRSGFCTRRRFSNSSEAIPRDTFAINAFSRNVQNTLAYAGFVKTFTSIIPNEFRHMFVLLLII